MFYRFSALWLRSKCSICSYQLNIWYVAHGVTGMLIWFLGTDGVSGACSTSVTGCPGIAVPPGSASHEILLLSRCSWLTCLNFCCFFFCFRYFPADGLWQQRRRPRHADKDATNPGRLGAIGFPLWGYEKCRCDFIGIRLMFETGITM